MGEPLDNVSFQINDNFARRTGITAKWLNGEEISVFGYNHIITTAKDAPSMFANSGAVNIHHLKTKFIFQDPILRSLIAEANSIFTSVQEIGANGSCSEYLKSSRVYRSVVRACLEKLHDKVEECEGRDETADEYHNFMTIFYSIECVWHLCEILLIDPSPTNLVVPQLLEWIRFHFPAAERMAGDILTSGGSILAHDNFWEVVNALIGQARVDEARELLQAHTAADTRPFQAACEILKTMPVYNAYSGVSLPKFRSDWQFWKINTESKLNAGVLVEEPGLEDAIRLCTGELQAWSNLAATSSCWYELLPGYLFFNESACKYFELGSFAKRWLDCWAQSHAAKGSSVLTHLDRVILNVMHRDMHQVLHDIQTIGDNQWFVVHLTDLLYHCGQLQIMDEQQNNIAEQLRESLLFDFGSQLMSRESLWIMGLDYLVHLKGGDPAMVLSTHLERIPFSNEKQASKIINAARKHNLLEVEKSIYRILASRNLTRARYGSALEYAIRSGDSILVSSIADVFLNHYSKNGEMLCEDVLSQIGAKMFMSARLVFLVKYFDFHQFYKQKELAQAAELLVGLLDSKITPDYFWLTLLIDSIPMLEAKIPVIPSRETYVILHHLEQDLIPLLQKTKSSSNTDTAISMFSDYRIDNVERLVEMLRLAIARNLSRAIIIESKLAAM